MRSKTWVSWCYSSTDQDSTLSSSIIVQFTVLSLQYVGTLCNEAVLYMAYDWYGVNNNKTKLTRFIVNFCNLLNLFVRRYFNLSNKHLLLTIKTQFPENISDGFSAFHVAVLPDIKFSIF